MHREKPSLSIRALSVLSGSGLLRRMVSQLAAHAS